MERLLGSIAASGKCNLYSSSGRHGGDGLGASTLGIIGAERASSGRSGRCWGLFGEWLIFLHAGGTLRWKQRGSWQLMGNLTLEAGIWATEPRSGRRGTGPQSPRAARGKAGHRAKEQEQASWATEPRSQGRELGHRAQEEEDGSRATEPRRRKMGAGATSPGGEDGS